MFIVSNAVDRRADLELLRWGGVNIFRITVRLLVLIRAGVSGAVHAGLQGAVFAANHVLAADERIRRGDRLFDRLERRAELELID